MLRRSALYAISYFRGTGDLALRANLGLNFEPDIAETGSRNPIMFVLKSH